MLCVKMKSLDANLASYPFRSEYFYMGYYYAAYYKAAFFVVTMIITLALKFFPVRIVLILLFPN